MKNGEEMKVRLISYSQPVEGELYVGENVQELIAYCARVSNPTNQSNTKTSEKLLSYLATHKHWSPFEMVSACLEIETTRDIARQILRHRSFSFQEFSQRYADPTEDLNFTFKEARMQDKKNRQNSIATKDGDLMLEWLKQQSEVQLASRNVYKWAIKNGIAKEQARSVLPEGLMQSRIYMNGTIRSWLHYIELRTGIETQKEHREVAVECGKVLSKIFPIMENFIEIQS
jgi:thymidylate synthase (FAD)